MATQAHTTTNTLAGTGSLLLTSTTTDNDGGGATLVSGSAQENRRVYDVTSALNSGLRVVLQGADGPEHVRNVKVWMPDPADPQNKSLEPAAGHHGGVIHPGFIDHLTADPGMFGTIRFMDWTATNNNGQTTWATRRPPNHAFASGSRHFGLLIPGTADQEGGVGVAWEHVIEASNLAGKDAWINLPHAADDYVGKLVQLFRYGSDADGNPYTSHQSQPYHPPLRSDLRVWVEHSNEIWSNGGNFRQGDWAQQQASAEGISKAAFNGRRAGHARCPQDQLPAAWQHRPGRLYAGLRRGVRPPARRQPLRLRPW
ncbi:MAG: hypothetical protein ACFCVE_06830 [Phycisphaerae bacterium]